MRRIGSLLDRKKNWIREGKNVFRLALALALPLTQLAGCAQNPAGSTSDSQSITPIIQTQPTGQTVPIGRSATFTVVASGTAPLHYQWSKNGTPITGATSSSYSTPTVALADSGANYQVVVTNAAGSAKSNVVTLSAGPRAPAIGDVRYLLWEQMNSQSELTPDVASNINGGGSASFPNALGTPLEIGPGADCVLGASCAWKYVVDTLPASVTGLTMKYSSGAYSSMSADLQAISSSNGVIVCIDPEPANGLYAVAWVQAQAGGFDYRLETVPPSQLAATVAADGASSRIVTAVSPDGNTGMADVISYGWQGDTTTVYDATSQIVTQANIASTALALSNQGYFISAFGGNDTGGYALVAMRVYGDTMPRPILYSVNGVAGQYNNPSTVTPVTEVVFFLEPGDQILVENQ